jgi:hypothetical protein
MNPPLNAPETPNASLEQIHSALFAQLVTGHAQMAMMLLGRFPNPQTGDLEAPVPEGAKHFIDQLEMLETKTKGNLSAEESRLLKQMLSATRLTFAEVIDAQLSDDPVAPAIPAMEPAGEDSGERVKFSKKY